MSKNNSQSRNRRSQPSKPYDVSKSFIKRVTTKVSSYIPQYLRSTLFGAVEAEVPEEDVPGVEEDVRRESLNEPLPQPPSWLQRADDTALQQSAPPQKRARIDVRQEQAQFVDTNNTSVIKNDLGTSVMSLESRTESRIIGSGMFSGMRGHAASSTPFAHFGSRLALGQSLTRSAPMEPQAGPSGLQSSSSARFMPPPSFMKEATEVNGDDMSDSSESTSGCSSLVPQGGRHDAEQPRSNNIKTLQTTLNSSGRGLEQRSRYAACDRESSLPQPAASNKRPCFDISILGPSTRTTAGEKLDLTKSPFYTGKTCYGGASAYKKLTITPSLNKSVDSLVNHTLPKTSRGLHMSMSELPGPRKIQMAPSTPRPSSRNASVGEASTASTVAKRILDAMESCSTPVSDCSQIPLNDSGLMQKRKRPAEEDLYEYRTPPGPRAQGPPSVPLQVPGVQELLKMKREQAKIQDSIEAARKRLQSQKKPWQEAQLAYSFRNDAREGSQYSNKMKGRQRDDDLEEMPQQVNLPQVALPITNLPKIDLGPSTFAKSSSSVGALDLPMLPEGATNFTFSTPIVVKTPNKNNSTTPSRPLSDASSPLKFSWPSQSNGSSVSNIPKDLAKPSSVNLDSKHKTQTNSSSKKVTSSETPKVTNSLGDMFKPAPGSWSCQVCDVRNKSESKSCVACTSPKPGLKPDPPKPSVSLAPPSSFGAKFSNAGKWECSGCMLYNDNSLDKCPSCTTAKPGSNVKPVSSFGAKFSNTGKWECSSCMVYNDNKLDKCLSCTTPKAGATPAVTPSLSGFGDKFKKPSDSWECSVCLVLNKDSNKKCVSCSSHKPGESSPPKSSLTFSFGAASAKTSSTDAPTFKFGVEPDSTPKVNTEVKFSSPSSTFTFGVQATTSSSTGSTTTTPSSTSVATPTPGFTFGMPSKATESPAEQKTFPAVSFASPTSGSLKRSAEPEPKGFQFGTTRNEKSSESPKISFPISEKPKESPKISFPDVSDNSSPRRDNSEEPSSKKPSFAFGGSNVTEEVAKLPVPAFSFGSKAAATTSDDKQQAPNFMFQQSSSSPKPKVAPAVTSAPAPALFSFGASASTTPAGTGFSIPSFGAVKPAEPIAKPAESVTKPAESIAKPAVSATPNFGTAKLADTPSMFGAAETTFGAVKPAETAPMFGAKPSNSNPMFGGAEKPAEKSIPAFGAMSKPTETTESPKPFSFGASAFGSNNTPAFALPAATTTASSSTGFGVTSTPSFGSNTGTAPAMFGSASPKPAAPMFGSPVTSVASSAASNIPLFGAPTTTSTVSIFGAKPTTTAASFGTATSAPLFGAASTNNPMFGVATTTSSTAPTAPFGSTKTVTFGEKNISATTNNTSPFTFGANAQASSNSSGAPPPYPFSGGNQNTSAPVGGFAFGSNTGAPAATSNVGGFSFNSTAATETKPFQFGAATPAFPAVKPPDATPMFGAPTTPMFNATAAPNPTNTFGATTSQFVENNNASAFQTPNFGFGSTPTNAATFGFSAGQNTGTAPTPAGGFMFGQQQSNNPPQFNPNIKPTFNFTQGAAPTMFQATQTQQSTGPVPQRKIKRATRRMTPR